MDLEVVPSIGLEKKYPFSQIWEWESEGCLCEIMRMRMLCILKRCPSQVVYLNICIFIYWACNVH